MGIFGLKLPKKVDNVFNKVGDVASRAYDQANPFDNGRTIQQRAPVQDQQGSVLQQATHSGLSNAAGNLVAKPFLFNPIATTIVEPARGAIAQLTNNQNALKASDLRQQQNLRESIPGFVASNVINAGQSGYNLGFKAPALDITGHTAAADRARTLGLQQFNKTTAGQATIPIQTGIANLTHASNPSRQEVGINTDATGAQKYFADPLMGTLGTLGLAKGGVEGLKTTRDVARKPFVNARESLNTTQSQVLLDRFNKLAQANEKGKQGLEAIKQAGNQAKFGAQLDATIANEPKLLPAPTQNFTLPNVENARIATQTESLAKQYTADADKIAKTWGNAPARLNAELDKLDTKYQARHADLLNGVGEFAVQAPKIRVTKTPAQDTSIPTKELITKTTPASDLKTLNIKIARVKDPARKAELVAERDILKNTPIKNTNLAGLEPTSIYSGTPKTPNAFARAWQTVNGVISQHGTGGKEISRRLSEQRNLSEVGQQNFLSKIPNVGKLNKNEFTTFVDTLDKLSNGEKVNVSPRIQAAVAEWNQAIPEIRSRAVAAGLDVGDLGPNYFPRQYKDLERNMGSLAEQMVRDGKATDLGDAMGKLQFMKNEYQKPFGNLEKTRQFDVGGYEKNQDAVISYINRSLDRITKAEQFGSKNEVLNELLARAQQEGYNAAPGSLLDKYVKIALGDVDKGTTAHKVSGKIRSFNALRSLSTAGLSNISQLPVNTGTVAGLGRTAKGIGKTIVSKKARQEATESGVLLEHSINDLAKQGLGTSGTITKNIASPFFRQIEKFNRQATAVVGKDYGNHLARKGDIATLRDKFGITGDIGKTLTRDQEIQMSRKLVEIAQFKVDPIDLPAWVDSPTGKLIAQFRSFGYKQTGFVYNQVLREAVKGNFLPLTRFVALGLPAGALSLAAKGAIKGTPYTQPDESNTSKALKYGAAVGAFGIPGSEGQNIYKGAQYGNTTGALAGVIGGPTASLAAETAANFDKSLNGNSKPLKKEGIRNIPAVGPSIANRVFPSKAQIDAKAAQNGTSTDKPSDIIKAAFNSPEGKKFLALSSADKKAAAEQDPNTRALYDQWTSAKKAFASPSLRPSGLDEQSAKTLDKFSRFTTKGKDRYIQDHTSGQYEYNKAKLASDIANGTLNDVELTKRKKTLAKDKVGADFKKDTRDLYGMSKTDVYDYLTNDPSGDDKFKQVLAYDDALVKAGLITKNKFRDKYGNVSLGDSSSGGRTAKVTINPESYRKTYSVASAPKTARVASIKKVAAKARVVKNSGKIKVTSKKVRLA